MNLKTTLITLSIIAGLLIVITFYVVFYSGGGTYVVTSALGPDASIFATNTVVAAEPTSTTLALASSSTNYLSSSSISSVPPTTIDTPAVTWTQGNETMSVVDASLAGSQLTLGAQVAMGSVGECVPLNLRLIADEQGDLSPPITPQFTFPDTGNCNGTPGETYSAQPVVFNLSTPVTFPLVLTTGGTANVLFEVTQNSDGSLNVQLPPQAD